MSKNKKAAGPTATLSNQSVSDFTTSDRSSRASSDAGDVGRRLWESVPEELRKLRQWIVHRGKVPHDPRTRRRAKVNNSSTWRSFEDALQAYKAGGFDGLGFVFTDADPYTGVDLDHALDDEGQLKPHARQIVEGLKSYTEQSLTDGVHVIVRAEVPKSLKDDQVEIYSNGRYFTVTGNRLKEFPATIEDRQAQLEKLHESRKPIHVEEASRKAPACVRPGAWGSDEEVLTTIRRSRAAERFTKLYECGEWAPDELRERENHGRNTSPSERDLALCRRLVFWCGGDREQIDRLFRGSKLYREKWDERHSGDGSTYGEMTLDAALCGMTDFYTPIETCKNLSYYETEHGLVWNKSTKDGLVPTQLTNFTARILGEVERDDGAETSLTFEIEGKAQSWCRRFEIPAERFAGLSWVTSELGAGAILEPGFNTKDRTRAAIQHLSGRVPRQRVFTHLGWRQVDGEWLYLHASGAIGPEGPVVGVDVAPQGSLKEFRLPEPLEGTALRDAVQEMFALLDLSKDEVTSPLLAAVCRAPLGHASFSLHLAGRTGTGKSSLAAVFQQFWGAGLDLDHLPGSWSSTGNSLEILAFLAKDTLLVVDDFAPAGTGYDVARAHKEAGRLLRAQANGQGRQRLNRDVTLRPEKPPRGLVLSTGEDVPNQQSVQARLLILELEPDAFDWDGLTRAQSAAQKGIFAGAFSAYVSWLAPQYETVREQRLLRVAELREEASVCASHKRTPTTIAELRFGVETFLRFVVDAGALSDEESCQLSERVWLGLCKAAELQTEHQRTADPAERFFELLASAFASGQAHLVNRQGGAPVIDGSWGWTQRQDSPCYLACGKRVGWISDDETNCYLIPEAAYRIAQDMAGAESLGVAQNTLWKRLDERHFLRSKDTGRHTTRIKVEGQRPRVLHISTALLIPPETGPIGPSGPEPTEQDGLGTGVGTKSQLASEKPVQKNGPPAQENEGPGPVGPDGPHTGDKRPASPQAATRAKKRGLTKEDYREFAGPYVSRSELLRTEREMKE